MEALDVGAVKTVARMADTSVCDGARVAEVAGESPFATIMGREVIGGDTGCGILEECSKEKGWKGASPSRATMDRLSQGESRQNFFFSRTTFAGDYSWSPTE